MSDLDLIDILDLNYPLMTILREKSPGTFAHSKSVANLLETIGKDLGLDTDSLKIAGYYHDIGKTVNPNYFGENQTDDKNPLDEMTPYNAYKYIHNHVDASARILVCDINIPREVIIWIAQHHGTTVMKYFFEKSGSNNPDLFRYKCQTPTSLEAGLLMICDHLEARSRSLSQSGKLESIDDLVELVINELNNDEQLDEITLKLGHFRLIKDVLKRELRSQYHKRVDYDTAKKDRIEEDIK